VGPGGYERLPCVTRETSVVENGELEQKVRARMKGMVALQESCNLSHGKGKTKTNAMEHAAIPGKG